jgi:NADP-dependent 3-hydroxy acid dehydrogenase YdfG
MNLYIIYGSETSLLEPLYEKEDAAFIRIFNKNKLRKTKNSIFIKNISELKNTIETFLGQNEVNKIIFIGAAFLTQNNFFHEMKSSDINLSVEVNISNYIEITRLILPFMLKIRSGNFIYLSSFRSKITSKGISLYAASKSFGESFFEVIGKEYGSLGVCSTSIRMGYFDGRMITSFPDERIKQIKLRSGNRKFGTQNDLNSAIDFIVHNPYTNGGVIELTGGINHEF